MSSSLLLRARGRVAGDNSRKTGDPGWLSHSNRFENRQDGVLNTQHERFPLFFQLPMQICFASLTVIGQLFHFAGSSKTLLHRLYLPLPPRLVRAMFAWGLRFWRHSRRVQICEAVETTAASR